MIRLFVGYDEREAAAYHVFCQSVIEHASQPVEFIPLAKGMLGGFDGQRDGTNAFIYSRFLVPALCDFSGWALFADGDMRACADLAELWDMRNWKTAVHVVKHDYQTKHPIKYLGQKNEDYPRKNWSSLILWNCGHPANRLLTLDRVSRETGKYLHRFSWLPDDLIGTLPPEWNHLVLEYPEREAKLLHHTIGCPGFSEYAHSDPEWHQTRARMLRCG